MTAAERKYVLVVDDERDVRNYLAAILTDSGYEVAQAPDGGKALEMVKERTPDLISLDLVMPEKSGAKFLFALRKNRDWSRIPVIIVTGHAHDDVGRTDMEGILAGKAISGPEMCLEKPVTPEGFVSAVRRQLGLTQEAVPAPVTAPVPTEPESARAELAKELEDADPETLQKVLAMLKKGSAEAVTKTAKRVLVIDDEPDVSTYLAALLSDEGYDTEATNDPDEGLRLALTNPPDLITLDIDMPGKSGVKMFKELKSHPPLRDVPIVVITGIQQDLEPLFHGRRNVPDIDGYITKPFDPEVLFATVADAIGRREG